MCWQAYFKPLSLELGWWCWCAKDPRRRLKCLSPAGASGLLWEVCSHSIQAKGLRHMLNQVSITLAVISDPVRLLQPKLKPSFHEIDGKAAVAAGPVRESSAWLINSGIGASTAGRTPLSPSYALWENLLDRLPWAPSAWLVNTLMEKSTVLGDRRLSFAQLIVRTQVGHYRTCNVSSFIHPKMH